MSPLQILLAVADPGLRAMLCSLVRGRPELQLVGVAMDADEAAELMCSRRPGVVILDSRMPCGGAPRALRAVSLVSPTPGIVMLASIGDYRCPALPTEAVIEYLFEGAASADAIVAAIGRAAAGPTAPLPSALPALARSAVTQATAAARGNPPPQ